MHILTMNNLQTEKDTVNITIAIKYKVKYGLSITDLHLSLPILKIKVNVTYIWTANISANGDR